VGGAALAVIAASLLIADLLHAGADRAAPVPARKIETPNAPGFPSPPSGAVVFARQDGANALALALTPNGRRLSLQASVVGHDGRGVAGLPLRFAISTATGLVVRARSAACGLGCYTTSVAAGAPRRATVLIGRGTERRRLEFALPRAWPPADATALVRRSGLVWRHLRTLVSHERLASGPRPGSTRHSNRRCDSRPRSGATFAMRISSPRRACAATAPGGSPSSIHAPLPGSRSCSTSRHCERSTCGW